MLVKPKLEALWRMHSAVDEVIEMNVGLAGVVKTAKTVRSRKFEGALVFPNSFRSALIPYLARVPVRVGMVGHGRVWMLTNVVRAPVRSDRRHQLWEYLEIAGVADATQIPEQPRLTIPETALSQARGRLAAFGGKQWIGLIPGAARGPSKQWPPEHFVEVGRTLVSRTPCHLVVFGTQNEVGLCQRVTDGIGRNVLNVAGETSIAEFAALLSQCRLAIANDSGGMHLASAVGSRIVAVFGLTDPEKTGPMGTGHQVICHDQNGPHSRDIKRDSREAREALRAITPDIIIKEVIELLV
jgi:heptosyltransferase-2